jgi:hypothetical protein
MSLELRLKQQREEIEELKEELLEAYYKREEMYMAGEKEWIDRRIEELESELKD